MKNRFWLGDEHSAYSFLQVENKIDLTPAKDLHNISIQIAAEAMEEGGDFGEYSYMTTLADNLAIVDVSGPLVSRDSFFNRLFGLTSFNDIRNAVFAAKDHPQVEAIVLNMDTPGGQASGVAELSDFLKEVDANVKPIYTYTGTIMASAGYWLGSVGREIYASKMATVGSIGVITVHASYERMLKEDGIDVTVLRAGEFKALGSPYEKLDDKARAQIESQMNTIYDMFLETVAEHRGTSVGALKETAAEGRVFIGADAVPVGLVDHITSYDAAIASISRKVKNTGTRSPLQPSSETTIGVTIMPGKKKVLTEAGVAALESGVPEAEVYANPEMVAEAEEEESAGEEAAAPAEEGTDGGEEAAPEGEEEPTASAGAQPQPELVDRLLDRNTALTTELAEVKAELKTLRQERDTAKATEGSLVKIAVQAIQRMQVSLGGTPMQLSDLSADVVLAQYNRTHTQFCQKFKVGATAEVPEESDFNEQGSEPQENASVSAAVHRLTSHKVSHK